MFMMWIICADGKRLVTPEPLRYPRDCCRLDWLTRGASGLSAPVFQRKWQLFRQLDAIAPPALGLIKRGIGGRQQHFELRASGAAGDTDANGSIDRPVLDHDPGVRKRYAHAL